MNRNMSRRQFLALLGISGAGALIASCAPAGGGASAPSTSSGGGATAAKGVPVLRIPGGDNGYPSPFTYIRGPGYVWMSFMFDTLVWKDSQSYIPWLATEWKTSEDGKTWTFTLRDGVKWHDGQPLTADDVIFSYQYAQQQTATNPLIRGLDVMSKIEKLGERQVQITFKQAYAPFLANIGGAQAILPKHIWEKVTDPFKFTAPEAVLGSGPYKLTSYDKASGAYLFEANKNFWLGEPFIKRIELVPTGDALLSLQQGAVDGTALPSEGGITDEVLKPFQQDAFGILSAPGEWNPSLHFNITKGAPYSEVKFRQACAFAINREEMVKRLLLGRGDPGVPVWMAPSNPWFNSSVEQYKFNLDKAKALLDELGYKDANGDGARKRPDGQSLNMSLAFDSNGFVRIAEMIRDMLKPAGIALTLKPVDRATLDSMTSGGSYELALSYYGGLGGDPDTMRSNFSSKSQSKSFSRALGYSNPRFDQLADQQLSTVDEAKRKAIVFEMEAILAQDVPALPLYYPTRYFIYRKAVFDTWYYTPGGIASGPPLTWNKQAFVTGQKTGLKMRGT